MNLLSTEKGKYPWLQWKKRKKSYACLWKNTILVKRFVLREEKFDAGMYLNENNRSECFKSFCTVEFSYF